MSKIQLSDHFTYSRLLHFTLPSIAMQLFMSIYGVVDGLFVSNFVGKTAFASVNLVMPFLMILGCVGAMLGVGGSALVAKTLGEQDPKRAGRYFTMLSEILLISGVSLAALGIIFIRPVARLLGATDSMMDDCVKYGRLVLMFSPFMHFQYMFQGYIIVAEKPKLGLAVTVAAGVTNMVLDALFVGLFKWGVRGAAAATGMSQFAGAVIPFVWFISKANTSQLHFTKTRIELKPVLRASFNGVSEMISMISGSVTGILYNLQLVKYAKEDGVAAYGVVMYGAFIFVAILMGYATGSSPIVSYHYGAQNRDEMKNMLSKSLRLMFFGGLFMTAAGLILSRPISKIFVGYDAGLLEMTVRGFRLCSLSFSLMAVSMYISSYFTALNDGLVSMEISTMRSLILPVVTILLLPLIFGLDGVWFAMIATDTLGCAVAAVFLIAKRKKYGY